MSGTEISNLDATYGYITNNYGIDINPIIGYATTLVYQTNEGLVIYPMITTIKNALIDTDTSSQGEFRLGVFSSSSTLNFGDNRVYDSYTSLSNGKYDYYSHISAMTTRTLDEAKNVSNFNLDYDFYNDWIILPISDGMSATNIANRRGGRVFLRWELKLTIGKNWYFEDIDLYSEHQTEYEEYAWSNYINVHGSPNEFVNDIIVDDNTVSIYTAEGLAFFSYYINHGKYLNHDVVILNDIDMEGRLFTPIGGGQILEYLGKNYFQGTIDGKGHTITNLVVINSYDSGLFGISSATSYKNLNIKDSIFISTKGSVGGVVAVQDANTGNSYKGSATFDSVKVMNINYLHTMQIVEDSIVGGIVGQVIDTVIKINNTAITEADIKEHNVNVASNRSKITQGIHVGGVIGHAINSTVQISRANNVFDITGGRKNTTPKVGIYVGGLIGYADANSKSRSIDNLQVRLDEKVKSAKDVKDLVAGKYTTTNTIKGNEITFDITIQNDGVFAITKDGENFGSFGYIVGSLVPSAFNTNLKV